MPEAEPVRLTPVERCLVKDESELWRFYPDCAFAADIRAKSESLKHVYCFANPYRGARTHNRKFVQYPRHGPLTMVTTCGAKGASVNFQKGPEASETGQHHNPGAVRIRS